MKRASLLRDGRYSLEWVKGFYDQAGLWFGLDPQEEGVHAARVETVARLCGAGPFRMLELGAGPGATAAAMADAGHQVTAIEMSAARAAQARERAAAPHPGSLTVLEGDFYTVALAERFDVVCCWETFGLGSDADQRRLLRRIAAEWLAPGGCALVDVYSPVRPTREAGSEARLWTADGALELIERCYFDPVRGQWIDEWQPVGAPEQALAQTVRCYTPADLLLLLEGTGLALKRVEVGGRALDHTGKVHKGGPLMRAWTYLAQLAAEA
jgi:SAM-dependent methyltransferase